MGNSRTSPDPGRSIKRAFNSKRRYKNVYSTEYQNKDVRTGQNHNTAKFVKKSKEGTVDNVCTKMKLGVWNAAEAATQDFQRLVNTVASELELKSMDVMGLCEANVYPNTITSCLKIPGYKLEVGRGVGCGRKCKSGRICVRSSGI